MNIHNVYKLFFDRFRPKRMKLFVETLNVSNRNVSINLRQLSSRN